MASFGGNSGGGHRGPSSVDFFEMLVPDFNSFFSSSDVSTPVSSSNISDSYSSASDYSNSDLFTNNDFMSYLEGLMASVGQENVENRLFNAEQAEISRKFSASEAQKNRDFQETMSNTSYQRAVKDLQAAGLNPILAYSQGGASTPSTSAGSSASASYSSSGGDTLSSLLNSFANLISSTSGLVDVSTSILQVLPESPRSKSTALIVK